MIYSVVCNISSPFLGTDGSEQEKGAGAGPGQHSPRGPGGGGAASPGGGAARGGAGGAVSPDPESPLGTGSSQSDANTFQPGAHADAQSGHSAGGERHFSHGGGWIEVRVLEEQSCLCSNKCIPIINDQHALSSRRVFQTSGQEIAER